jgi:hypothetical protein
MNRKSLPGLTSKLKEKLIQQGLERRLRQAIAPQSFAPQSSATGPNDMDGIAEQYYRFDLHPASSPMARHGWILAILFSRFTTVPPAAAHALQAANT